MTTLSPLDSSQFIARISTDVKISTANITKTAKKVHDIFKKKEFTVGNWKLHELHPKVADTSAIDWIFVVDTLNFSFWTESNSEKYSYKYNDNYYSGYWSICAALNNAIQKGIPITYPHYYANLSQEQFYCIFQANAKGRMTLPDERRNALREAGKILIEKYGGSFANCVVQSKNSSQRLLKEIVENFPSYKDEALIHTTKVCFYKRAQILIADIWACFEGKEYGEFYDINTITMFADYRVPQVLRYLGILEFSDSLDEIIRRGEHIPNGDLMEIQIRGCSIWATELLVEEIKQLESEKLDNESFERSKTPNSDGSEDGSLIQRDKLMVNSILLDYYLWDYRRGHDTEIEAKYPHHKTRCIYY